MAENSMEEFEQQFSSVNRPFMAGDRVILLDNEYYTATGGDSALAPGTTATVQRVIPGEAAQQDEDLVLIYSADWPESTKEAAAKLGKIDLILRVHGADGRPGFGFYPQELQHAD